jgi:hypothetical protein
MEDEQKFMGSRKRSGTPNACGFNQKEGWQDVDGRKNACAKNEEGRRGGGRESVMPQMRTQGKRLPQ